MKKNFQTVRIVFLACFAAVVISTAVVAQEPAHTILKWMGRGLAGSYLVLLILFYAKPSLFNDKVKVHPHQTGE